MSERRRNELNLSHRLSCLIGLVAGVVLGQHVGAWSWLLVILLALLIVALAVRAIRNEGAAAVSTEEDQ